MPTPIYDESVVVGERLGPVSLSEAFADDGWIALPNDVFDTDSQQPELVVATFGGAPEGLVTAGDDSAFVRSHSEYAAGLLTAQSQAMFVIEKTSQPIATLHSVTMHVRTMANNDSSVPPSFFYQLWDYQPADEVNMLSLGSAANGYWQRDSVHNMLSLLELPDPVDNTTYEFDFPYVPLVWTDDPGDEESANFTWRSSLDGSVGKEYVLAWIGSLSGALGDTDINGEAFLYEFWLDVIYDPVVVEVPYPSIVGAPEGTRRGFT